MTVQITTTITTDDLKSVFDGNFPSYHPESYFQSRLNDEYILLAKKGTTVCGFLIYTILWGNSPMIELIKIKPAHQKHGIGTKLFLHAITEIKNRVPCKIIMSSSEVVNDMGNRFHKKMGFEHAATIPMYHGEENFYKYDLEKETA